MARDARVWIAGGVACALIATIAVIASGYDAREVPRAEPGVWVTRDAGQYARVNTDTGEIDVVRKVSEPSGLAQSGDRSVLFTQGNRRAWPIDAPNPVDVGAEPAASDNSGVQSAAATVDGSVDLPEGARDIVAAGRFLALRTEAGEVYAGELRDDGSGAEEGPGGDVGDEDGLADRIASLGPVEPQRTGEDEGDADAQGYRADAIALADDGTLAMFSADEGAVRSFDVAAGVFDGDPDRVPADIANADEAQLTLLDGAWALLDDGTLWRAGDADGTALEVEGEALLQAASGATTGPLAGEVLVADTAGLIAVAEGGGAERVARADGTPARPVEVDGSRYAAWLGQSGGELWRGEGETVPLQYDDSVKDPGDLRPAFRSNGDRAVLSELGTGMLWTVPDGRMIPLSEWTISDPPKQDRGAVVVDDVTEQVPPTAVADRFGVRAGEPAPLPVLLNDFDANKRDVLTIVPESLGEAPLPEEFGTLELQPDQQSLTVRPAADATGSATFRYRITDGELQSESVTVTLSVVADDINTAPEWCPVEGCQRQWRVPSIIPGGTLVTPVLEGWVDPEGDVMTLADAQAVRPEDPVRAIVTADGRLAVRHTDPNAGASDVMLRITVRDGRGEERTRELQLAVRPDAAAEFAGSATTVKVGDAATVNPLERVAGGSGSFALGDAVVQSGGDGVRATPRPASGTVIIEADSAGAATIAVTIRDTVTGVETTGQLRVTATTGGAALVLPPLRAYVRPLADSTVEVLDTIPGAGSRSLTVAAADVVDGELRADVIGHARVRVAGSTADGGPGRIGSVDVAVSEGDATATGRLTVFQVPESSGAGAIAVADAATVRAGSVVDIRVLDNDVAAPGERLLLHPDVTGSGAKGELAFASGSTLRYLAPEKPGTYRLGYTTYGASSPESSDVGAVYVTVVAKGSNRDPQPAPLVARVAAGEQTDVQVPLSGVDPDGDRVQLLGVAGSKDPRVAATLASGGTSLAVSASANAEPGTQNLTYSVRDGRGGTAAGSLRVIVTATAEDAGAPVAVTDQVRLAPGTERPVAVRPLDNDVDPARGKLKILSVEPNVPGGKDSAEYRRLAARIDTETLGDGILLVRSGEDLGTVSYRYTIRSSATKSTADGLVVVQTSERVGVQAPTVSDTVLSVRDRAQLEGDGVDVLSDKVRWSTGDASTLRISLPKKEQAKGYRIRDGRIAGSYDPDGDLVAFRLAGEDLLGQEVTSYGFLIVPPLDDLRLTLRAGLRPLTVDEGKTVGARLSELVELGPGDTAELKQTAFPTGRVAALCEATSANALQYAAGKDAPWADTCLISARLVGQKNWTVLPVPVVVVPREPVVELEALTRTIAPGQSETIRLADMVRWQGGREGDASRLRFDVSGGGERFEVRAKGPVVEVTARADAVPGRQDALTVSVTGAGESRAPLTLRVGEAPQARPRGGTVALTCEVGDPCSVAVVGVPGEFDPFAGKSGGGLKLDAVTAGNCTVAAFSKVDDATVAVSWSGDRTAGGACTAGFTVRDAQGRLGEGAIAFDAQGLPAAPSIQQTGYDATSASFAVTLSGQAHPSVSGVRLEGGGSTSCTPQGPASYSCVASGLRAGEKHEFTARAVNSVGESQPSSAVSAWAYAAPPAPQVSVESIKAPDNTSQTTGGVRLRVGAGEGTSQFRITYRDGSDGGTIGGDGGSKEYRDLPVGPITFSVTPVTKYEVPPIGGSDIGQAATADGFVIGAPILSGATLSNKGVVEVSGQGAHQSESVEYRYTADQMAKPLPDCRVNGQRSNSFDLPDYFKARAMACASSDFGISTVTTEPTRIGGKVPPPGGDLSYAVSTAPSQDAGRTTGNYGLASGPSPSGSGHIQYLISGTVTSSFALSSDALPSAQVRQCFDPNDVETCSEWGLVHVVSAPTTVTVGLSGACWAADAPPATLQAKLALLTISGAAAGSVADVAAGTPSADGTTIPLTVTWSGAFAGLQPVTLNACYTPAPLPDPEP